MIYDISRLAHVKHVKTSFSSKLCGHKQHNMVHEDGLRSTEPFK